MMRTRTFGEGSCAQFSGEEAARAPSPPSSCRASLSSCARSPESPGFTSERAQLIVGTHPHELVFEDSLLGRRIRCDQPEHVT